MRSLFALAVAIGLVISAQAQHDDHAHHHDLTQSGDAQIVVTINPEARVSAVIGAPLPPPPTCGSATELKVKIINQGFVTAPLRASIAGDGARYVALHMDTAKLSGKAEDTRALHLVPIGPNAADVTIAFSIDNNIGDLGGRDRVHLLVNCTQPQHGADAHASHSMIWSPSSSGRAT